MIVGMTRVKNEGRWLREVLESYEPVCERLYVLDDSSTDDTREIAEVCGAKVFRSPFNTPDEARDKDHLLRFVEAECPAGTWCIFFDGDEILEPGGPEKIRALTEGEAESYQFKILYLWNDREHVRVDGVYGKFYRPSMFKLRPGLTFKRTGAHANFHCSSVPAQQIRGCVQSDVAIHHIGYMDRDDRIRKYRWYNAVDNLNSVEDSYRHIVIGDVFPSESVFKWGGPLELRRLPVHSSGG